MPQSKCSSELQKFLEDFSEKFPEVLEFCTRVLESRRYNANVILMLVDAALSSSGVNYFSVVIPRVLSFEERFVRTGEVLSLKDLSSKSPEDFLEIWKNRRSWEVAIEVARALLNYGDGVDALRNWASSSPLHSWRESCLCERCGNKHVSVPPHHGGS